MIEIAKEKDKQKIIDYVSKKADSNIFFIADIEKYGIDNDLVTVFYTKKDDQINMVLLCYHGSYVLYSEKQDYDKKDVISLVNKYNIKIMSCSYTDYIYLKDYLQTKFTEIVCNMAKLISPKIEKRTFISTKATENDAKEIALSILSIEEFDVISQKEKTEEYIAKRIKHYKETIKDNFHQHYIIYKEGKVVSNANTSAICSKSAVVGGVFTLKEYRGQGFATDCVSSLCKDLLSKKITPVLFYENPIAAKIYKKIGFEDFDKWVILRNL